MIPKKYVLDRNMPPVLGWDRLEPLPERFTAYPDPKWRNRKRRLMIINPEMEELIPDGRPTVIDLFAGCGGFSLGFIKAGFRVIASVEWDYWAHVTYCSNIPHMQQSPLHVYSCDIKKLHGREILMNAGITEVDCVIGGPPCQGFSWVGKRKVGDHRDSLIWDFGRLIKELQPKTWVMENVPGLKSKKLPNGKLVFEEFMKYVEKKDGTDFQALITQNVLNGDLI